MIILKNCQNMDIYDSVKLFVVSIKKETIECYNKFDKNKQRMVSMNIISHFNKILEENFKQYLKKYFNTLNYCNKTSSFTNYFNFINDLDSFSDSFIKDIIKSYFEYIDECFFNSSYRKKYCKSNGFYIRKNYTTLFGEISFKRRYYYDNKTQEWFFFTDLFLGLPKRKHFDPFVCADMCQQSTTNSYSKAGKIVSEKIGKRTHNCISIPRATVRNIVLAFDPDSSPESDQRRIERLFVMLDEKFVGSQFNDGKDHMIKAAVIFENTELVYKYKKKKTSMDRYRLVHSHVCASVDNTLLTDTIDYIYNTYDTDKIKEIIFMGDCAKWIKNFPNSHWFHFTSDTKVQFAMDGFHFSQALKHLTTQKHQDVYDALFDLVKNDNKENFILLCNQFKDLNPDRSETIENKMNYILNNWKERKVYQNNPYMKCSMESHISHIFADLFTSRPKAYSKNGLIKLLKLRVLKSNGINIKQLYLQQMMNPVLTNKTTSQKKITKKHKNIINKYDFEFPLLIKNKNFLYN